MSPDDLSVLNKHTGMQHNTPFNPPPQSDFPFGPCQQNTGVHLLTWTAPAADPQRLQGSWTHWENTTTPEHLFFSCDNNVIRRLLYCFSSRARAWRDCGSCCCCCCGWWWWWWWSGWLDETLQAGTILRACDKSTPESMWSLQGTACALAPSPGCVEAEPGKGRERKAGREVFEEGRGGWKCERERGREGGEGMRGRQVHAVTTSCSQLSAAHGRLHVSVTWPDTLQETLAAFTWEVNVKKHTERNPNRTHTHAHTQSCLCSYAHVHSGGNRVYCTDAPTTPQHMFISPASSTHFSLFTKTSCYAHLRWAHST